MNEIIDAIIEDQLSYEQIAEKFNVTLDQVHEAADMLSESDEPFDISDSMADAEALASAGWGVDEDYIGDNDYFDDY